MLNDKLRSGTLLLACAWFTFSAVAVFGLLGDLWWDMKGSWSFNVVPLFWLGPVQHVVRAVLALTLVVGQVAVWFIVAQKTITPSNFNTLLTSIKRRRAIYAMPLVIPVSGIIFNVLDVTTIWSYISDAVLTFGPGRPKSAALGILPLVLVGGAACLCVWPLTRGCNKITTSCDSECSNYLLILGAASACSLLGGIALEVICSTWYWARIAPALVHRWSDLQLGGRLLGIACGYVGMLWWLGGVWVARVLCKCSAAAKEGS